MGESILIENTIMVYVVYVQIIQQLQLLFNWMLHLRCVYIFPCFVRIIQHFVCFRLSWGVDEWLISFLIRWFPSSNPLFAIVLIYNQKKMNREEQKQFHYQVCQIFLEGKYVLTAKVISISFLFFSWWMRKSEETNLMKLLSD